MEIGYSGGRKQPLSLPKSPRRICRRSFVQYPKLPYRRISSIFIENAQKLRIAASSN